MRHRFISNQYSMRITMNELNNFYKDMLSINQEMINYSIKLLYKLKPK